MMMNTYGHSGESNLLICKSPFCNVWFLVKDDNDRYVIQGETCARMITDFNGYFILDLMPWCKFRKHKLSRIRGS